MFFNKLFVAFLRIIVGSRFRFFLNFLIARVGRRDYLIQLKCVELIALNIFVNNFAAFGDTQVANFCVKI